MIAPVLVMMFFGTVELTDAILAKRRLGLAASMVGDLATNRTEYWLHEDEAEQIVGLAGFMLAPYSLDEFTVRMTAVTWDEDLRKPVVAWSFLRKADGSLDTKLSGPYAVGATFDRVGDEAFLQGNEALIGGGEHLVVTEIAHPWVSRLSGVVVPRLPMSVQELRVPRREKVLEYCTDAGCTDGDDWDVAAGVPDDVSFD